MTECVKVVVRSRPMNQKEIEKGCKQIVNIHPETHQVLVSKEESGSNPKQ